MQLCHLRSPNKQSLDSSSVVDRQFKKYCAMYFFFFTFLASSPFILVPSIKTRLTTNRALEIDYDYLNFTRALSLVFERSCIHRMPSAPFYQNWRSQQPAHERIFFDLESYTMYKHVCNFNRGRILDIWEWCYRHQTPSLVHFSKPFAIFSNW